MSEAMSPLARASLTVQVMDGPRERVVRAAYTVVPDPCDLMAEPFTLRDLQSMHELVLGKSLARQNFRNQMLRSGLLEDTGENSSGKVGKPARLYRKVR